MQADVPCGLAHFTGKTIEQAAQLARHGIQSLRFLQDGIGRIRLVAVDHLPNETVGGRRLHAKSLALVDAAQPDEKHPDS